MLRILLIAMMLYGASLAQEYRFEHLIPKEGINHNLTYAILQDSYGFMWFGTFYGLIRYDGHQFTTFRHIPLDSTTLSSDDIISLYEGKEGAIWVGTWSGGLNRFDPVREEFRQFRHDPSDPLSLSSDVVYAVCEDKKGRLWVGTEKGLDRLVPAEAPGNPYGRSYFVHYRHEPDNPFSLNNNPVRALHRDGRGRLWVGVYEGGLHYYDDAADRFIRLEEVTHDGSTSIVAIHEDNQDRLWVGTWGGGLKRVVPLESEPDTIIGLRTRRFQHDQNDRHTISNDYIWSIGTDRNGNIWVGSDNGLNRFNPERETFDRYYSDSNNANTISSNKVSAIYLDRSGVLWIGTFRGGIDKIVPDQSEFEYFLHNPFDPNSLIGKSVNALLEDERGRIWAGTSGGITQISKKTKEYNYRHLRLTLNASTQKSDNYITSMVRDENGTIWVGTYNGLKSISPKGLVKHYNLPVLPGENEQGNVVTSLLLDSKGWLWVGSITHGLNIFDRKSKVFTSFRYNPEDSSSLSSNYVISLYEDKDGVVWVGTYSGLNVLTLLSPSMAQPRVAFVRDIQTASGRSKINDNVFCLYEDSKRRLWVGTNDGLYRYDKKDLSLKRITEQDGLSSNVVSAVVEDTLGNIWISTHKGIVKHQPGNDSYHNYYALHGLQGDVFVSGSYLRDSDGKVWFGGINGLNCFNPSNISSAEDGPEIVFTSFRVFSREKKFDKMLNELEEIRLNHDENFFTINFAAMDFRMPERNQYYYYLEGFDRDWVYSGTRNYASYTNLDPGNYVFHVKAANSDGVWNEKGAEIALVIAPPFWLTWWFKSAIALVTLVALLFIIYLVQRYEKRKTELNRKLSELKLQALRAQMNPHFIFNTINSIQYFISCNDQKSAFLYLSKFSKLMRQTLENSEKSTLPLHSEIEMLRLYLDLQRLRFENKFDYSIEVDPEIDVHNCEIPSMLIQPYIENAINHGISHKESKGHLQVELTRNGEKLICTVKDDGIGINEGLRLRQTRQQDHTSSGMRLTRERLDIINSGKRNNVSVSVDDLGEENNGCSGTRVTIHIPMHF